MQVSNMGWKRFPVLLLAVAGLFGSAGQAQRLAVPPVDEAIQNAELVMLRDVLLQAVAARDVDVIIAHSCPDIRINFGGGAGHAALREYFEVPVEQLNAEARQRAPEMRDRAWEALENTLRLGGNMRSETEFWAPYTWNAQLPHRFDVFETLFVTGSGVALRASGEATGKLLMRLDYEVVTAQGYYPDAEYLPVQLGDGTHGYVHADYLRSPVDYRAEFQRADNGHWQMCTFIAGD